MPVNIPSTVGELGFSATQKPLRCDPFVQIESSDDRYRNPCSAGDSLGNAAEERTIDA